MDSYRGSSGFVLAVLMVPGLAGLFGAMVLLMNVQPGFMGMRHFSEPRHRLHDLTFTFLLGTTVIGAVAQLRKPASNVAAQLMALIPIGALALASAVTNLSVLQTPWLALGAFVLLAATLHPARHEFARSLSLSQLNHAMLALVVIAAGPLLAFALSNIGLQRTDPSEHAAAGHYGFLAALGFTVIGVGFFASLRPAGWPLTGWIAGLLPALLGVASLIYPTADSSLEPVWALAAVGWGGAFVAVTELVQRRPGPAETLVAASPATAAEPGPSRSAYLVGAIAVAFVILFVVMHLSGAGPGLHAPPAGGP